MSQTIFSPGCALELYKPHLADEIERVLRQAKIIPSVASRHTLCCHHDPKVPRGTRIINVCAGCDRRFRELYAGVSTVSLWEVLANLGSFSFPDYGGVEMAIQDACPTRSETRVHKAVRTLLSRMNIRAAEPELTREKGLCCGDNFYPHLPIDEVKAHMARRAAQMPVEQVAVYCVSCVKSMHIGGKKPRYLVDLLFGEPTTPGICEPDEWHNQLDEYIAAH